MKGKGRVSFGGLAIVGGVGADITLDDGSKWTFVGTAAGLTPGGSSMEAEGDFPGHSHMAGACTFSLVGAAAVKGRFEIKWSDTHGMIGEVNGEGWGASMNASGGMGIWTKS